MGLQIKVNGELVKEIDGTVLSFTVNTPEGEKAKVALGADGYKQVDIVTQEISPGGAVHLSQVEEYERRRNRALGAGLPDPMARKPSMGLGRQNPGTATLQRGDDVDDVRFRGDPDAPPPINPFTGETLEGSDLDDHNKALEERDKEAFGEDVESIDTDAATEKPSDEADYPPAGTSIAPGQPDNPSVEPQPAAPSTQTNNPPTNPLSGDAPSPVPEPPVGPTPHPNQDNNPSSTGTSVRPSNTRKQ